MTVWPMLPLARLLTADRRPLNLVADQAYTEVGVRSFGRGVFHKPAVTGAELGTKRVFSIMPDRLAFNIVFAWEGAVARTTDAEAGTIASHRFPIFECAPDLVDLDFMTYLLRSEFGLELMRRSSPGSAGRNRTLSVTNLLEAKVPLPPLPEQRRIASWLSMVEELSAGVLRSPPGRARDSDAFDFALESTIADFTTNWYFSEVGRVAEVNPSRVPPVERVAFVPMAAVSDEGAIAPSELGLAELKPGYRQFIRGDVIFARITPCMENGKAAVFDGPLEMGYGSTEFHVLRPKGVSAEWLHMWIRRRAFRDQAAESFQGTVGQQRVPASFFDAASIPVPPSRMAELDALNTINDLAARQRQFRRAEARRYGVARALLPSALNQVFGSLN